MNKNIDKIHVDENGERWEISNEISCPNAFAPQQHKYKVCYEIEFEFDLIVRQPEHIHRIAKKENGSILDPVEQMLSGEVRDIGLFECGTREAVMKPKVNLKCTSPVKNSSQNISTTAIDHEFSLIAKKDLHKRVAYFEKHIPRRLKKILSEISKMYDKQLPVWSDGDSPSKEFDKDFDRLISRIQQAKETLRQDGKKITKTNVGKLLYADRHSNPVQQLNRNLDKFFLTFEEI